MFLPVGLRNRRSPCSLAGIRVANSIAGFERAVPKTLQAQFGCHQYMRGNGERSLLARYSSPQQRVHAQGVFLHRLMYLLLNSKLLALMDKALQANWA